MAADFDPLARIYRWLEYGLFGPGLWQRRTAYLYALSGSKRVLMAGEGDGRFLAAFLQANATATVEYVDASARMLALARERAGIHAGRVRFRQGDLLAESTGEPEFDAVVTHFFLDCFNATEVRRVIEALAARAFEGADWIVSEFQAKPAGSRWLVGGLYLFFRWTTGIEASALPDYRGHLARLGFRLVASEEAWRGLLISERWQRQQK